MKKWAFAGIGLAFLSGVVLAANLSGAAVEDKPKYDITEVMQKAHKSGLLKKVAEGKASADEKKELVELYTALAANKPPKGDATAWKKQTEKMLVLAKDCAKGEAGAGAKLLNVAKCATCHEAFKPDE